PGAACSSGAIEPSHVLTAMGLRPDRAKASIRFSLGKQNTSEDVDFALELVPKTVARLRELSPVYNKAPSCELRATNGVHGRSGSLEARGSQPEARLQMLTTN